MKKKPKIDTAFLVAAVSLGLSVIALAVSVYVGLNQVDTNNSMLAESEVERNLISTASFDFANHKITLIPYSDEFKYLENTLFYPIDKRISSKRIEKSSNSAPVGDIEDFIRKTIFENHAVYPSPRGFVDYNGYPILIASKYIYKGRKDEVVSLYYLSFYAKNSGGKGLDDIRVELQNIEFIRNMEKGENPASYLMAVYYRNVEGMKNLR